MVVSTSDPGYIHDQNIQKHIDAWPYDEQMFIPKSTCRTCKRIKPARSKHCSLCQGCIAVCDHHCVWIGNCVGFGNMGLFILFLLLNTMFCLYGAYTLQAMIRAMLREDLIWDAPIVERGTGKFIEMSLWRATVYALMAYTGLCILLLVCVIYAVFLIFFCIHQVRETFIRRRTTNEGFKSRQIIEVLKFLKIESEPTAGFHSPYSKEPLSSLLFRVVAPERWLRSHLTRVS